jgi:hypothetical protein
MLLFKEKKRTEKKKRNSFDLVAMLNHIFSNNIPTSLLFFFP